MREKTPSFVTEIPLTVSQAQERILLARLEAARQVYNACLGQALKRREHLLHNKQYQTARNLKPGKERTELFKQAHTATGFREYDLHAYAKQFGHCWLGEHLDSLTIQKLASRAFDAVEHYHFGERGRPRFKSANQLDSVEGKTNSSGILWRTNHIEWLNLRLDATLDPDDAVLQHGLNAPVKYVRIVRRKIGLHNRFYAQLVCKGKPFQKPKNTLGQGKVGLDIGPSTIAVVSETKAFLEQFCDELLPRQTEIRCLQRKIDRQRRANNPDNFNSDGTVKQGKKTWKKSRRQRQTEARLAELHRKQAAYRQSLHGKLINRILALGNDITTEKLSYRAFQKCFGKSIGFRAPGTFVKRLKQKAASATASVTECSTHKTKLSQTCHHCGQQRPKPLSERWHRCDCGIEAQRDLYSAFLASCVENNQLNADLAERRWSGVDPLLQTALSDTQQANGRPRPSSFGLNQKLSLSSGKAMRQSAKRQSPVDRANATDALPKADHPIEPPAFRPGE